MPLEKVLKIVVIGPAGSGKSVLTNFFTNHIDLTKVPYSPTKGVRILETDVKEQSQNSNSNGAPARNIAVQLWDAGGERHNHQYWNALIYNADGLLVVYNGDRTGQEKDIESILYFFNQRPYSSILKPLSDSKILAVAHHHKALSRSKFAQSSSLPQEFVGKVKEIHTSIADSTDMVREEFTKFINTIYSEESG